MYVYMYAYIYMYVCMYVYIYYKPLTIRGARTSKHIMKKTHHPSTHGLKPRLWCCRPARERGFHSSITGWVETCINLFLEFFFCMFLPIRRWHRWWFGMFSSCRNSSLVLHFDDGNRPTSKRWPFFSWTTKDWPFWLGFKQPQQSVAPDHTLGVWAVQKMIYKWWAFHIYVWLVVSNMNFIFLFSISYMGCHPSHSFIFFREVGIPPTRKTFAGGDHCPTWINGVWTSLFYPLVMSK